MQQEKETMQYQKYLQAGTKVFFIGIGGISMSGLAEMSLKNGLQVAGSDMQQSPHTDHLAKLGITVYIGHSANHIKNFSPDFVVISSAVHEENPEWQEAKKQQILCIDRSVYLGWLNRCYEKVINISGTHGKTTTTAMCALILIQAGLDPTVHLGAELKQFETTIRLGKNKKIMVSEACEYQRSFLNFYSTTEVILNIDYDHVDTYKNLDEVIDAFLDFVLLLKKGSTLILPAFSNNCREMITRLKEQNAAVLNEIKIIWFGSENNLVEGRKPDYYYKNVRLDKGLPVFDVYKNDRRLEEICLEIPGEHNVLNAIAAIAAAMENGASSQACKETLDNFQGAEGRFTDVGYFQEAKVFADYAHHPAAAKATIAAAQQIAQQRLWVVFQPLTFNRTKVLFQDYVDVFKEVKPTFFVEIFSNREPEHEAISSKDLVEVINQHGGEASFFANYELLSQKLAEVVQKNDVLLILGPEDVREYADRLTGRNTI